MVSKKFLKIGAVILIILLAGLLVFLWKPFKKNEEGKIKEIGQVFIEKYGSYSYRDTQKSSDKLKPYITEKFYKKLEIGEASWDRSLLKRYKSEATTTVLSVEIKEQGENTATLLIKSQRQRYSEIGGTKTESQNYLVKLIKQNGEWKVDEVAYQD